MQTDQKMVAYYFKKIGFLILRTLNEFLKQVFMRNILRKVFYFKIREINLRTIKRMRNIVPSKTNRNKIIKYNFWQPSKLK